MEKAIKKAIEGGWKEPKEDCSFCTYGNEIFLDPLFWQALGRAEKWQEVNEWGFKPTPEGREVWREKWHELIDHLAQGKLLDEFFNDILK